MIRLCIGKIGSGMSYIPSYIKPFKPEMYKYIIWDTKDLEKVVKCQMK